MKRAYILFVLVTGVLTNWPTYSQVEDFMAITRPMAIDFKETEMYIVINSSGGAVTDGAIAKVNLLDENLDIELLVEDLIYPRAIIIVGDYLYYALPTSIRRINVTVQNPVVETVVSGTIYARAFSFKDNNLYIAENDKISKIDLTQSNFSKTTVVDGFTNAPLALSERNNELFIAHGHNISKIDLLDPSPILTAVLTDLVGKVYGMDLYNDYLYIEQSHDYPVGAKKIIKCDLSQENLVLEDVTNLSGNLTIIDIKFHNDDLYVVFGAFANKISKVADANTLTIDDFLFPENLVLYPNPTEDFISLSNLSQSMSYSIVDGNGKKRKEGITDGKAPILVKELNSGFFFISFNGKKTYKFMKK